MFFKIVQIFHQNGSQIQVVSSLDVIRMDNVLGFLLLVQNTMTKESWTKGSSRPSLPHSSPSMKESMAETKIRQ